MTAADVCTYCGHAADCHNPDLGAAGGLFNPGTRPCTAIVMVDIPRAQSAAALTSWWPCSCNDLTDAKEADADDEPG